MAKRKGISASLRWSVFARDGFTCRYCGAQAGQDGVELCADHVVSVAEGGETTFDNLVTSCKRCNGGKSARSLEQAPTSAEVIKRLDARANNLQMQAEAISRAIKAQKRLNQAAVNLKCKAYGTSEVQMIDGEAVHIERLCQAYGADKVLEWYSMAAEKVSEWNAIKYVYGIIRRIKEREAEVA